MALKDILPGDRKKNKTIPVSHSYKHDDVKKVAKKMKEKNAMMTKSESLDKAKKFMDTLQTAKSKDMTEREGSFAKGGRAGYKSGTTLAELEKEKSGSDKKIDKFAFVHIEKMKKKKKETGPGSSNPKRVQRNLGGRAGYKDGSKGCKLAMKGKGKAYGKNS